MRRFGLISLGLHTVLLAALVLWFRHGDEPAVEAPDKLPAVELVMVEQKGSGEATPPVASPAPAPTPSEPTPPAEPAPSPPLADTEPAEALPPRQPAAAPAMEPAVATLPPPPAAAPPAARTSEPDSSTLKVNLGGTDSETNAIARGDRIIPAGLDAKYRNRQPVYPPEALRHAEQGAVLLLVHIAPNGVPRGVDVAQSSGYPQLDEAARDAVANWHFLPAVKDGAAIPFDMQFRVVFQLE
jgi:protein TonB